MGPVFADLDGDGRPDLWVTDSKFNRLMKNTGPQQFDDVTERASISQLAAQYELGHGRPGFRQRWTQRHFRRPWRPGSPGPAGARDFSQPRRHEVR
jgi:hypothetical protein